MDSQKAQQVLNRVRACKQASDPLQVIQDAATQKLRQEALRDVMRTAAWSAGAGGAIRGGYGLLNLLRRNTQKHKHTYPTVAPMPLPYPVSSPPVEEEEEEKTEKAASLVDFFKGEKATNKQGIPWLAPAAVIAGIGGAGLGWSAVDKLMDRRRKEEMEDQVRRERDRFQQALLDQFETPVKSGGDHHQARKLATDLEALYDVCTEKRAVMDSDTAGKLVGAYGYYAAPMALISGWAAHSMAKKRQKQKIMEKALERRRLRSHLQSPAEIHAIPVPTEVKDESEK